MNANERKYMKVLGGSGLRPRCGAAVNSDAAFPVLPVAAEAAPTASLRDFHGKASTCGARPPGDGRNHDQRLSRRGFLGLCVGLLGLTCPPIGAPGRQSGPAAGGDACPRALAAGPRERALHEADFYRPHELAG
jgi:hypothetical protein